MRLASSHEPVRRRRGQAIFAFLLGLAMVALLIANVFLFMEFFENFHGRDDVQADAEQAIAASEAALREFRQAESRREAPGDEE